MRIVLSVVDPPQPNQAAIMAPDVKAGDPVLYGDGPVDLICGGCTYVIGKGLLSVNQVQVPLLCPGCGKWNLHIP